MTPPRQAATPSHSHPPRRPRLTIIPSQSIIVFPRTHRTQRLQLEVPGELPNAMVGELMDEANTFWFNENTGEMRWDRPEEVGWKQISDERGATFWFNQVTGAAQWEDPVDISWKEEESAKRKGEKYYWNEYTGEATFGKPEPLAWSMKKEL